MILADATTDTLGFAGRLGTDVGLNSAWVVVAAILVLFMQAGFAMLEIGFVRGKRTVRAEKRAKASVKGTGSDVTPAEAAGGS